MHYIFCFVYQFVYSPYSSLNHPAATQSPASPESLRNSISRNDSPVDRQTRLSEKYKNKTPVIRSPCCASSCTTRIPFAEKRRPSPRVEIAWISTLPTSTIELVDASTATCIPINEDNLLIKLSINLLRRFSSHKSAWRVDRRSWLRSSTFYSS